jgi:hypothetical protein
MRMKSGARQLILDCVQCQWNGVQLPIEQGSSGERWGRCCAVPNRCTRTCHRVAVLMTHRPLVSPMLSPETESQIDSRAEAVIFVLSPNLSRPIVRAPKSKLISSTMFGNVVELPRVLGYQTI